MAFHQAALTRIQSSQPKQNPPKAFLSLDRIQPNAIILDSGASGHYLKHKSYFVTFTKSKSFLYTANGTTLKVEGFGTAVIPLEKGVLEVANAQFVPDITNSLLAMSPYLISGCSVIPSASGFQCVKDSEVIMTGEIINNILILNTSHPQVHFTLSPLDLHCSLGHPNNKYLNHLFPRVKFNPISCNDCLVSKMTKAPFTGQFPTPSSPLNVIHMDLCGSISPPSQGGNRYFLKIVDGYSRYAFIYPIRISDNGGEFVNHLFQALFRNNGIQHLKTAPYTPQQNPFSERGNKTTIEKSKTLLSTSGLPFEWWGDAVCTSVYLENRIPHSSLNLKTPYELWHGKPPKLDHLAPFGCKVIAYVEKKWRNSKFSPSGSEGVLLGFDPSHHSFRVWIPTSNKIEVAHHAKIIPDVFPFKDDQRLTLKSNEQLLFPIDVISCLDSLPLFPSESGANSSSNPINLPADSTEQEESFSTSTPIPQPSLSTTPDNPPIPETTPTRPGATSKHYDYVNWYNKAPKEVGSDIDPAQILTHSRRPRANFISSEPSSISDPRNIEEARKSNDWEGWKAAINVEKDNCVRHKVWEVVPKPSHIKELNTTWVLKMKYDANGDFVKKKARLCARGFRQVEGIDYNETYAPTGRLSSL